MDYRALVRVRYPHRHARRHVAPLWAIAEAAVVRRLPINEVICGSWRPTVELQITRSRETLHPSSARSPAGNVPRCR
jgi:hypothetical protein